MNSKKWIVYLYVCKINNKKYVGKTCNKYGMKGRAKNGKGYRRGVFHNAIEKYGWNNFAGEILKENLTNEEANYWETYYIRKYRTCIDYKDCNGYNMTEGGDGGEMLGYHHTDETKTKISNAFKGRFVGELNPMYGVHDNHICNEDGHLPKEIREKLSKSAKRRMKNDKEWADKMQSYNESKMRAVNQYDLEGNYIRSFKSRNEAMKETGICASTIHKVCKRTLNRNGSQSYTAGGFQWRFSDDCEDIGKYIPKKPSKKIGKDNHNAIKINQYDINGKYIKTWDSISEAAKHYKINSSTISGALNRERQKNAKGFQWRRYEEYSNCKNIEPFIRKHDYSYCMKKVVQYDINGNKVEEFISGKMASEKIKISQTCISLCCKGKIKTAGGYIWKYADEVENNSTVEAV